VTREGEGVAGEAVEATGRTVEEAIDRALAILGATDDEVEVEILAEPEGGFLRRGREARVRVRFRDERTPEDLAAEAEEGEGLEPGEQAGSAFEEQARQGAEFLEGLLRVLGLDAEVSTSAGASGVRVELSGPELGLLIGRHGATLEALQEVTRAAVQRRTRAKVRVTVDVEGYLARRRAALERRARSLAARARKTGRPQALEPMSPAERKVVHEALAGFRGVRTSSEGEGPDRHVVIHPA
jgi:spoIIIJ-associated protein